jgi:DNA-binding response OmpR family regulator
MSKKLLIAEDDHDLRNFLHDELTRAGFTVTAVKDGSEAVVAAVDQLFDLFLLDMLMPNLDGLQTIRVLHRITPGVPIIGLTGYASQSFMLQTAAYYGVNCLIKPVVMADLVREINETIRLKVKT